MNLIQASYVRRSHPRRVLHLTPFVAFCALALLLASSARAGNNEGLAVDFGSNGLWQYSADTWTQQTDWDPIDMAAWDGKLAVNFGPGLGLYSLDATTWSFLSPWDSVAMEAWGDRLVVAFGSGRGLWLYDSSGWTQLAGWDPEKIVAWGDKLAVAFGSGRGLWLHDGADWTFLTDWDCYDLVASGDRLAAAFDAGRGVWSYASGWTQLTDWEPEHMHSRDNTLTVAFGGGRGIWSHDSTNWSNLTTWDPYAIDGWDEKLVAAFDSGRGLWQHDGTSWQQLTSNEPLDWESMANNLVVALGSGQGLYNFDGAGWTNVAPWDPEQMETVTVPFSTIRVPQDEATIQAGIDAAEDGDLVLVSPGTYNESLVLSGKTITLASEFYTTQDSSLIGQTIIDGGGAAAIITVEESVGPDTSIVGFTIRDGDDGMLVFAKLNILNNHFSDTSDGIDYERGGGLCRFNVFEDNSDDAIDLDGPTEATIEDNIMRNNGDDGIEIRLHKYSGPVLNIVVRNNIIRGNGEDGIQIIDHDGASDRSFVIEGNLFEGNAMVGLGMMDNGVTQEDFRAASIPDPIHLLGNTFVDHDYAVTGGDNVVALNNIFVGSTTLALKQIDGNSIVAHSLLWNNGADNQGSNIDSGSTVSADPLLDGNHRLQTGSPAIDAGTAFFQWQGQTVLDLPGSAYNGAAPDLGAFEK